MNLEFLNKLKNNLKMNFTEKQSTKNLIKFENSLPFSLYFHKTLNFFITAVLMNDNRNSKFFSLMFFESE